MNPHGLAPYTLTEFQQLVTAALDVTPESDQLPASLKLRRQSRRKSSLFRVPSFHSGGRSASKAAVDGNSPEGTGLRRMVRGTLRRIASMFIREPPQQDSCFPAPTTPHTPVRPRPRANSFRPLAFPLTASVGPPNRKPSCSTTASSPDSMTSCATSASSHPPMTPTHSYSPLRLPIPSFRADPSRTIDEGSPMDDDSIFSEFQLDLCDPFVKADVEIVRSKRRTGRARSQILTHHSQIIEERRLPPTPQHPQEPSRPRPTLSQPSSSSSLSRSNCIRRSRTAVARPLDARQSSPAMPTKQMSIQDLTTLFPTPPPRLRPLSEQLRRDQTASLPNFSRGYTTSGPRPVSSWSDTSSDEDDGMEIESIIAAHGDIQFEERVNVDLDVYGSGNDWLKRSSVFLPDHKGSKGRRQRRSYYHHGRNDSGVRVSVALPEPPELPTSTMMSKRSIATSKTVDGPRPDSPFPFL